MQITRTLIVDDDASFRRRVKELLALEPDIEVIGEAADGREAILKARELKPDLVLMDVRMPELNGVDATRQLKDEMPALKVIILTVYDLQEYREAAMANGASGYVVKKSLIEELVPTIGNAWGGGTKMKHKDKTRDQLIDELVEMHQRITELEASGTERLSAEQAGKRAEEALRESEERYRRLAENVRDIIWTTDMNLQFTYFSPSIVHLGYTVEEAMALTVEEFLTPASLEVAMKILAEELAGEDTERMEPFSSRTLELEVNRKNGSTVWTETRMSFLRDAEGRPVGVLGVSRDITERKRLEEQFRQSQKMEAVGRMAGGIAHDFNNLLTVITGFSEILLHRHLDDHDPLRGTIEEIKKAGERAASLTRQLLAFSRKQVHQPKVLDLSTVVADTEKMLRRLIGEDIDLVTFLDPTMGHVKADPGQIEQVIMNLAVNARDAMPQGGKLTIETANVELDEAYAHQHVAVEPGPYVMLTVSDTGIGMDAETQSHLFEPFFTTKEEGQGTGLGLSSVYGIVKQSGGYIWVYSEPGQGTTFKIYLQRVEEAVEPLKPSAAPTRPLQGSETVLVVEDDEGVRTLARDVLKMDGYTVLEAHHGGEALLICEQHKGPIHLMVTDVVMPGMSGRELVEHLVPLYPEMEVLYMSGYTDNAIVHHCILEPGTAFLQKPFTPQTLVRKVRQVLDAPQQGQR